MSAESVDALRALVRMTRLLERACPDLSLAHYRILAAVAAGEGRASRVAARLALGKPAVSANVDALCRRGLLTRADVSGDQRAVALRLTRAGERVLAEAERSMLQRLDEVLAHTTHPARTAQGVAALGAGLDALIDERLAAR